MPALIRFLLCTGVRIGEALQIEDKDMDLVNNVFILRDTKKRKREVIADYAIAVRCTGTVQAVSATHQSEQSLPPVFPHV